MMKLSLQEMAPLHFRASTMLTGSLGLFLYVASLGERMKPDASEWRSIALLGIPNVLGWHTLAIFGVKELASGRAAILGFTMPIMTVLLSAVLFREKVSNRLKLSTLCAALAITLLLWHEFQKLSGRPIGVVWMLSAALCWAIGTLMFRRVRLTLSPMVVTVWMLLCSSVVLWVFAIALEPRPDYGNFSGAMWLSLLYGVLINYGFAQLIWFGMARDLPPATSAMSTMAIPVVGTLAASVIIQEVPHWQDWLAMGFVTLALAGVLWPAKNYPAPRGTMET